MPIGAAIGGGLALFGSMNQADATRSAAKNAAKMAQFDPYNVYGQGIGSATFGGYGNPYANYPVMPVQGFGGGMGMFGQPQMPYSGGLFAGAAQTTGAPQPTTQQTSPLFSNMLPGVFSQLQNQAFNPRSMTSTDYQTGSTSGGPQLFNQPQVAPQGDGYTKKQLNVGLDPQMEVFRQAMLGGAAQQNPLFDQLQGTYGGVGRGLFEQGLGTIGQAMGSPQDIAQRQYDLAQQLMAPGRAKQQSALENRLFAQGRLGSTGGAQDLEAMRTANAQRDVQAAYDSLNQGLGAQGQLFGQGMNLFNTGMGLFGNQLNVNQAGLDQRLQMLNASRALAQDPLQLANMGIGIGGRQAQAGAAAAPMMFQAGQANPMATAMMGMGSYFGQNPGLFGGGTVPIAGGGTAANASVNPLMYAP